MKFGRGLRYPLAVFRSWRGGEVEREKKTPVKEEIGKREAHETYL